MSYESFKVLKSSAVPLPIENVDTDQIIPARFLKATERKGFGENYEETTEEDSGITVDEHGTEWYEDEVGVWWFRDPGEEDWAEFVE